MYNAYANYETWVVLLWVSCNYDLHNYFKSFKGQDISKVYQRFIKDLSKILKCYIE